MLRVEVNGGWWLITHPEHARLAGEFASHWGNKDFAFPAPRAHVLRGIFAHDDGWSRRDSKPLVTSAGKPSAFSVELVGKYSAFEEIDLREYLAVRREAVRRMAQENPYAAILISMHTHNLLSERVDRVTIRQDQLAWLDAFLVEQTTLQRALRDQLLAAKEVAVENLLPDALRRNFELLQACDNLSLLCCVDFGGRANLLHSFHLSSGDWTDINVERIAERRFRLTPYPLDEPNLEFSIQARRVSGHLFESSDALQAEYRAAPIEDLKVFITE